MLEELELSFQGLGVLDYFDILDGLDILVWSLTVLRCSRVLTICDKLLLDELADLLSMELLEL